MPLFLNRETLANNDREAAGARTRTVVSSVQEQYRQATAPEPAPEPQWALPSLESLGVGGASSAVLGAVGAIPQLGQRAVQQARETLSWALPSVDDLGVTPQLPAPPSGQPAAMPAAPVPPNVTFEDGRQTQQPGLQPGESVGSITYGQGPRQQEAAPAPAGDRGAIDNSSRESFVRTAYPYMLEAAGGDANLAELMLAKAISENGSIGSGRPFWANNFSGIKGEGDAGSVEADTWEDYGNGPVNIRDRFAAYSTPQKGMAAFMQFLHDNSRYHPALQRYQQSGDADQLFRDILAAGYATDKAWADKVQAIRASQVAPIVRGQQQSASQRVSLNAGVASPPAAPQDPAGAPPPAGSDPLAGAGSEMARAPLYGDLTGYQSAAPYEDPNEHGQWSSAPRPTSPAVDPNEGGLRSPASSSQWDVTPSSGLPNGGRVQPMAGRASDDPGGAVFAATDSQSAPQRVAAPVLTGSAGDPNRWQQAEAEALEQQRREIAEEEERLRQRRAEWERNAQNAGLYVPGSSGPQAGDYALPAGPVLPPTTPEGYARQQGLTSNPADPILSNVPGYVPTAPQSPLAPPRPVQRQAPAEEEAQRILSAPPDPGYAKPGDIPMLPGESGRMFSEEARRAIGRTPALENGRITYPALGEQARARIPDGERRWAALASLGQQPGAMSPIAIMAASGAIPFDLITETRNKAMAAAQRRQFEGTDPIAPLRSLARAYGVEFPSWMSPESLNPENRPAGDVWLGLVAAGMIPDPTDPALGLALRGVRQTARSVPTAAGVGAAAGAGYSYAAGDMENVGTNALAGAGAVAAPVIAARALPGAARAGLGAAARGVRALGEGAPAADDGVRYLGSGVVPDAGDGATIGRGGAPMGPKEPWQMSQREYVDMDFETPQSGSWTPKEAAEARASGLEGQYETLHDVAKKGDPYQIREVFGVGYERDFGPSSMHLTRAAENDKPITIYRTSDIGDILPGAFVSESKAYALQHAEANIHGGGKVKLYSRRVRPSELVSWGDPHEFIWVPKSIEKEHERAVLHAIIDRKVVPVEVMAEYPDMVRRLMEPDEFWKPSKAFLKRAQEALKLAEERAQAPRGEPPAPAQAGSGLVPGRATLANAAQGSLVGAVSEDFQAQQEGRETDPMSRLARGLGGAALGIGAGRAMRRGAGQQLGSGFVPQGGRPTVEVLEEQLARARSAIQAARASGDTAAANRAIDRYADLESQYVDALNARRALEPAIRSDVGQPETVHTRPDALVEDRLRAQFPDERVSPEDARNLGGPASVPVSTAGRMNAGLPFDPASAAVGAGAGAATGEEGEADPWRTATGLLIGGILGRRGLSAAERAAWERAIRLAHSRGDPKAVDDLVRQAEEATARGSGLPPGAPRDANLNRPISEEPTRPRSLTDAIENPEQQGALPGMGPLDMAPTPRPIAEVVAELPPSVNTPPVQRALSRAERRREEMQRRGLETPSVWDWLKQAGYAGIYGPATFVNAALGSAQELLLGQPKEIARALVAGRPRGYGAQASAQVRAMPDGLAGLARIIMGAGSEGAAARSGGSQGTANLSERVVNPVGHFAARALERPGELLTEAPDALFRPMFLAQGQQREAGRVAAELGLRGREAQAYADELARAADELRANPDSPVVSEAVRRVHDAGAAYADQMAYKGDAGSLGRWLGHLSGRNDAIGVLASFLTPFPGMVGRMATGAARSTPGVGLLPAIRRGQPTTFDVVYDQAFGTALAAGVAYWAFNGGITGSGPADPEKRQMMVDQGWQPNSYMVGGYYIPNRTAGRFQPMLDAAGELHDAIAYAKKNYEAGDLVADLVKRGTRIATNTTGLSGMADLHDMFTQGFESRFPGWVARSAIRYVPYGGVLRGAANATDDLARKPDRWSGETPLTSAIGQNLSMAVPGLRQRVPAAQDSLGRDAENPQKGAGALIPKVTQQRNDPVIRAFQQANVDIGRPPSELTVDTIPFAITPREQRQWNAARGEILTRYGANFTERAWWARPEAREAAMKDLLQQANEAANQRIMQSIGAAEIRRRVLESRDKQRRAKAS